MTIASQYEQVAAHVAKVCEQAGRKPDEVTLIAVSKTVGIDGVRDAIEGGAHNFGENRPDSLLEKFEAFPDETWHFIGNIQSRRISDIVACADWIHSVYQKHHLEKINDAAKKLSKRQKVLLEVNVSGEESKSGLAPQEVKGFIMGSLGLDSVELCGLMTMAPRGDAEAIQASFEGLAQLRDEIQKDLPESYKGSFTELSMGMSEDWPEAIAAGATMVRIGRAIFSEDFAGSL